MSTTYIIDAADLTAFFEDIIWRASRGDLGKNISWEEATKQAASLISDFAEQFTQ